MRPDAAEPNLRALIREAQETLRALRPGVEDFRATMRRLEPDLTAAVKSARQAFDSANEVLSPDNRKEVAELLKNLYKFDMTGVPYRGIPPGMTDLLEGRLQVGLLPVTLAIQHVQSGRLRALAVLPVILFHAGFGAFSGGFVGVDIFFVISGYLITSIIAAEMASGSFSLAGFYERRARRILPALFLVIAVCTFVAPLVMMPSAPTA